MKWTLEEIELQAVRGGVNRQQAEQLVDEVRRLRRQLDSISQTHRPLEVDGRLCSEGCNGAWPCSTRLEADEALGYPRPQSR